MCSFEVAKRYFFQEINAELFRLEEVMHLDLPGVLRLWFYTARRNLRLVRDSVRFPGNHSLALAELQKSIIWAEDAAQEVRIREDRKVVDHLLVLPLIKKYLYSLVTRMECR